MGRKGGKVKGRKEAAEEGGGAGMLAGMSNLFACGKDRHGMVCRVVGVRTAALSDSASLSVSSTVVSVACVSAVFVVSSAACVVARLSVVVANVSLVAVSRALVSPSADVRSATASVLAAIAAPWTAKPYLRSVRIH